MTRAMFVNMNRWGTNIPCKNCCPEGYRKPPNLKTMVGVCCLYGQDTKTNEFIYECSTCKKEYRHAH